MLAARVLRVFIDADAASLLGPRAPLYARRGIYVYIEACTDAGRQQMRACGVFTVASAWKILRRCGLLENWGGRCFVRR